VLPDATAPPIGPGHTIFVFEGDGTTTGQDQGITLLDGQRLIGEGVELTFPALPPLVPAGNPPVLTNVAGDGVTLAGDNEVSGLRIEGAAGHGILGDTQAGNLTLSSVTVLSSIDCGIRLNDYSGGALALTDVVADDSGSDGLLMTDVTGSLAFGGTASSLSGNGGRAR
jgi:hypothetical protein